MGEQNRLGPGPLLDDKGNLAEAGYAFSLQKQYRREAIKAPKWRIKEWDYYYVGNDQYGVALTVADNGYMAMASVSVLDFRLGCDYTKSVIGLFPLGKMKMPRDSRYGDVVYEDKKKGISMKFLHQEDKRRLICYMAGFGKQKKTFRCDILLQESCHQSMVIATPFKKKAHFYYNQKINNQIASGYAKLGDVTYDFNEDSYGVLDWGRGVWTYRNTWYWCSVNSSLGGVPIGWNLGYGFGDTSAASENMFFYGDKAYKLDDVRMDIPLGRGNKDDFMKPWTFRSVNNDIAMEFTPVYDRHADLNVLFLRSNQHQVFGTFTGTITVEGKAYRFVDLPGFAEKVYNKW